MKIGRNRMEGKFIVLEGIDKSGKTTLSQSIFSKLVSMNRDVVLTHEPTEHIDEGLHILNRLDKDESLILTAMFLRDRLWHNREIEDNLKRRRTVICDRYTLSTMAYQGVYLKEFFSDYQSFYKWMNSTLSISHIQPDLTIFIDFNSEMFKDRFNSSGKLKMFEKADYLKNVYEIYLESIKMGLFSKEFLMIPGNLSMEKTLELAMKKILEL
ncbi:dTMP kinase [Cuniculiplasma sp. SKW3]|uniref:dTMP kinase n=1 Tax=unclassified Cuniculiplasma TaxID=2619706 RepID=UPI003FD14AEA